MAWGAVVTGVSAVVRMRAPNPGRIVTQLDMNSVTATSTALAPKLPVPSNPKLQQVHDEQS